MVEKTTQTVEVPRYSPTEQMRKAFEREYTAPGNFERAYIAMIQEAPKAENAGK